jgi:hypothetical protein
MKKVKTVMLGSILAGVFFLGGAASAAANPLVTVGLKSVCELGEKAAREAVEKTIREAGERLSREALEKVGREAWEKAFREAGDKALREAWERGVRGAGGRLSREAMEEIFGETMEKTTREALEKATRETVDKAVREGVENAAREAWKKTGVKFGAAFSDGGEAFLSDITAEGSLVWSANPADAITIPRVLADHIAAKMQQPGSVWNLMFESLFVFIP